MSARPGTANLQIYNTPNVASHYASLDYLTPCERFLFDSYLRPVWTFSTWELVGAARLRILPKSPLVTPVWIIQNR